MPEHKDIPEDGLHEPKGVSTAGASNVYVSDGAGSGVWSTVDSDTLTGTLTNSTDADLPVMTDGSGGFYAGSVSPNAYGSFTYSGNSTATAVTAAGDGTLSTDADYTVVTVPGTASPLLNMANGTNYLEISVAGTYYVSVWTNLFCTSTTTTAAVKVVVNDTVFGDRRAKAELPNGSDYANLSGSGFLTLSAGDQVKIAVAANKTTNITLEDLNISLHLVEAS